MALTITLSRNDSVSYASILSTLLARDRYINIMSSDAPLTAQDLKDDLEVLLELADNLGLTVVGALLSSAIAVIPIVKH